MSEIRDAAGGEGSRLDRELRELVEEIRVLLPGVQIVFGFLLVAPFADRFGDVSAGERAAYVIALLGAVAASVLLIAPTTLHRLRWRQCDKEWLLRRAQLLVVLGSTALAVALAAGTYLVVSFVLGAPEAVAVSGALLGAIAALWFGVPMARARRRGAPVVSADADGWSRR